MSMAWEVSNQDVENVLNGMVSRGEIAEFTDEQMEHWADCIDADEVEEAALYGDDMDEQVGLAENEILRQLRELFALRDPNEPSLAEDEGFFDD